MHVLLHSFSFIELKTQSDPWFQLEQSKKDLMLPSYVCFLLYGFFYWNLERILLAITRRQL